jgi:hypothetical protein
MLSNSSSEIIEPLTGMSPQQTITKAGVFDTKRPMPDHGNRLTLACQLTIPDLKVVITSQHWGGLTMITNIPTA